MLWQPGSAESPPRPLGEAEPLLVLLARHYKASVNELVRLPRILERVRRAARLSEPGETAIE